MVLVLALNARVAGPIWPPNRMLDCSTPRRAISLSVNSASEAAMGTAESGRPPSSLMVLAPWLFPALDGERRGSRPRRGDHRDLTADQIGRQRRQALDFTLSPAIDR